MSTPFLSFFPSILSVCVCLFHNQSLWCCCVSTTALSRCKINGNKSKNQALWIIGHIPVGKWKVKKVDTGSFVLISCFQSHIFISVVWHLTFDLIGWMNKNIIMVAFVIISHHSEKSAKIGANKFKVPT